MRDRALAAIERRSTELTKIIDRLLLSSRIEAGRVDLRLAATDAGPLIRERSEALAAAMDRTITCRVGDGLPAVQTDSAALITVVDHLLDDAVKYSPGGEPIEVHVDLVGEDVRIEICDAGVGMDAEQVGRCFEKCWQAESTDVRRFGGTGIGLYIVRSVVEAMWGDIAVASTSGPAPRSRSPCAAQPPMWSRPLRIPPDRPRNRP